MGVEEAVGGGSQTLQQASAFSLSLSLSLITAEKDLCHYMLVFELALRLEMGFKKYRG